jgi:hypothetical protein
VPQLKVSRESRAGPEPACRMGSMDHGMESWAPLVQRPQAVSLSGAQNYSMKVSRYQVIARKKPGIGNSRASRGLVGGNDLSTLPRGGETERSTHERTRDKAKYADPRLQPSGTTKTARTFCNTTHVALNSQYYARAVAVIPDPVSTRPLGSAPSPHRDDDDLHHHHHYHHSPHPPFSCHTGF